MARFFLYSKENTAKEIRNSRSEDIKPIPKDIWTETIKGDIDCTWGIDTELGKMHLELLVNKNVSDEEIEKFKIMGAFCFIKKNKYPTDFQIAYFGYKIEFVFPRLTKQRLEKMKELADKLDCYFVEKFTIISEDKYVKLLEKTK